MLLLILLLKVIHAAAKFLIQIDYPFGYQLQLTDYPFRNDMEFMNDFLFEFNKLGVDFLKSTIDLFKPSIDFLNGFWGLNSFPKIPVIIPKIPFLRSQPFQSPLSFQSIIELYDHFCLVPMIYKYARKPQAFKPGDEWHPFEAKPGGTWRSGANSDMIWPWPNIRLGLIRNTACSTTWCGYRNIVGAYCEAKWSSA